MISSSKYVKLPASVLFCFQSLFKVMHGEAAEKGHVKVEALHQSSPWLPYAMYTMLSSCLAQEAENPSEALVANIHVPLQELQELRFQKLKLLTCDVPRLCIEIDVEALWLLHPWAQVDKKLEISSYFIQICELILKKMGFKWSYPLVIKNSRTKIHTFPYDICYLTLIYPQTIAIFQCTDASFNYRGYPHRRHPVEDRCLRSNGHSC